MSAPLDAREVARLVAEQLRRELPPTAVSYTPKTAAAATGLSVDQINKAIRAGDLAVTHPVIDRRPITNNVIGRGELLRWLANKPTS